MKAGYVDTSCLVAIAFGEPGSRKLVRRLRGFESLFSSDLLEAELRSTLVREGVVEPPTELLSGLSWVLPNRRLTPEFERVLAYGYIRGADLRHLAVALFLSPDPSRLYFLTLDRRQREVASALGFVLI